jgi:hypothetical protein
MVNRTRFFASLGILVWAAIAITGGIVLVSDTAPVPGYNINNITAGSLIGVCMGVVIPLLLGIAGAMVYSWWKWVRKTEEKDGKEHRSYAE